MNDWADALLRLKNLQNELFSALIKREFDKAHEIACVLTDTAQELEDKAHALKPYPHRLW